MYIRTAIIIISAESLIYPNIRTDFSIKAFSLQVYVLLE